MKSVLIKYLISLILLFGLTKHFEVYAELVTIQITAANAKSVKIVGSYDGWKQHYALTPIGDDMWQKRIDLHSGRYEYQFVIDGIWVVNTEKATIPNGFGELNNILIVD